MLDMDRYQNDMLTFILPTVVGNPLYFTLGLAGETGEVAELVKKTLRDRTDMDIGKLTSELGDVLFYLSQIAQCYGVTLSDVAETNRIKLESRRSRGVISGSGSNR
jgi:NTP pyrophosphatase (non-canonical NTP hydrolase)